MNGEDRITGRKVLDELLPQITKLRKDLEASLVSLRYVKEKVDGRPEGCMGLDEFSLVNALRYLQVVEECLCQR